MVGSRSFDVALAGSGGAVGGGFLLFGRVVVVAAGALPFTAVVLVLFVVGTPLSGWLGWVIVLFRVAVGVGNSAGNAASARAVNGDLW